MIENHDYSALIFGFGENFARIYGEAIMINGSIVHIKSPTKFPYQSASELVMPSFIKPV